MTDLTPDAVRAIMARADAATAGPWFVQDHCQDGSYVNCSAFPCDCWVAVTGNDKRAAADFISSARTDLPLLADSWLAQHAEIERWKSEREMLARRAHDLTDETNDLMKERDDLRRRLEAAEQEVERLTKVSRQFAGLDQW